MRLSISATTRQPRPGERDGVDYHFLTAEQFETLVSEAAFAERYGLDGVGYRSLLRRAAEVSRDDVARLAAALFAAPRVIGRLAPR